MDSLKRSASEAKDETRHEVKKETDILQKFEEWLYKKKGCENIIIRHLYVGKVCSSREGLEQGTEVIVSVIERQRNEKDIFEYGGKSYPVVYKYWGVTFFANNTGEGSDQNYEEIKEINKYLKENASSFFKEHSNVEMICASLFKKDDRETEEKAEPEPCIAIYCSFKGVVPLGEKEFPEKLDKFATDIREGFFYLYGNYDICANSSDHLDPLRMGAAISMERREYIYKEGTLGGFVQLNDGETGFITCAHVLHSEKQMIEKASNLEKHVVQPPEGYEGSQRCGYILKSAFPSITNIDGVTVDAAVVKLTTRTPEEALFAELKTGRLQTLGFSRGKPPKFCCGKTRSLEEARDRPNEKVLKCGMITGLTLGKLEIGEIFARYRHMPIEYVRHDTIYMSQLVINGIEPTRFSDNGDSGALVFQFQNANDLQCIGMIIGEGKGFSIATPIEAVLNALGVTLKKF